MIIETAATAVVGVRPSHRATIALTKQRNRLDWERVAMVDWSQGSGWLRLKVILPILCILTASVFIYLRTRAPQPAQLAPGVGPGFGRHAARQGTALSPLRDDSNLDSSDTRN